MATGQTIINDALTEIEAIAAGGAPSTSESNYCLRRLNAVLDSLSAQAMPIPQISRDNFTLTGPSSYTIGPAMTFATTRPIKIESAAVRTAAGARMPVRIVPVEAWTSIADTTRTGLFADVLYYDNGYPTGNIYLSPAPAAGTLELYTYKPLTQIAALGDTVTLPEGYERMLVLSLAVEVAAAFGAQITQGLMEKMNDAKTSVFGAERANVGTPNQVEPQAVTAR